jgi:transcriptional regulator with XRE-family HTH domain
MKPIPLVKQVGQEIAAQRKLANLTQAKVAEKLEIEAETVSRIETGAISPTLERLDQFSRLFNCPVVSFFREPSSDPTKIARSLAETISHIKPDERTILVNFVDYLVKLFKSRR